MPNNHNSNRRKFILGAFGLAIVPVLAGKVVALNDTEANALIGKLLIDLNKIINSGKSQAVLFRDFEKLFNTYGDVPIIARSALGVPWRSASASQRSRYVKAFSGYMARKWGKRFGEFKGGEIVVSGSKKAKGGYLVNSMAHLKGQSPFAVDWQVSDKSGKDLMFNLYIEGISLLATERAEISAMLDKRKGNLETLIAHLSTLN
ncbi:MAG: phospholipid transport system substrate-binding protein [Paracoccaceae bacterium]|jgi:phospholipid transport system substrate-binding protein